METTVRLLYDNAVLKPPLQRAWGFACVVDHGDHRLLFDTGWDGDIVLKNSKLAGVDLSDIDTVVISHDHWDHIGGLPRLLGALAPNPTVFLPARTSNSLRRELARRASVVAVEAPQRILPGVHTTGQLGLGQKEQSLVLKIEEGLLVVTGCAHPGLDRILDAARAQHESTVVAVIGGFHDFSALERLDRVPYVLPCHCTQRRAEIVARRAEQGPPPSGLAVFC